MALAALGNLAVVTAQKSKEGGGKTKSPPKELTVDLGNGVKLEMVLIPAGEFLMGSPASFSTPTRSRTRNTLLEARHDVLFTIGARNPAHQAEGVGFEPTSP